MIIDFPESFTGSFNYVDCGSAGDLSNRLCNCFSQSKYIGFDPQLTVPLEKDNSSVYFPIAAAKESGTAVFYKTQNVNCSSFYPPNHNFLNKFKRVGGFFEIIEKNSIPVVALDQYLPDHGIDSIDFMELDTQGSELDILHGSEQFLATSLLGVRVEVEFSEMYQGQPLFGDVDSYLRQFGFMLFDLERYHLKRKSNFKNMLSREQIVWGQALYFKEWNNSSANLSKQKLCKLAIIASFFGFRSYCDEIIEYLLLGDVVCLSSDEKKKLNELRIEQNSVKDTSLKKKIAVFCTNVLANCNYFPFHGNRNTDAGNSDYFWKD